MTLKTITITFDDSRIGHERLCVLWTSEGTTEDFNNALEYAKKYMSNAKVHTFEVWTRDYKALSLMAHNAGGGL